MSHKTGCSPTEKGVGLDVIIFLFLIMHVGLEQLSLTGVILLRFDRLMFDCKNLSTYVNVQLNMQAN